MWWGGFRDHLPPYVLTASTGLWQADHKLQDQAFDGNTTTFAQVQGIGASLKFDPIQAIDMHTLAVYLLSGWHGSSFDLATENGGSIGSIAAGSAGWQDVAVSPSVTIGAGNALTFTIPHNQAFVAGIRINGAEVKDGVGIM